MKAQIIRYHNRNHPHMSVFILSKLAIEHYDSRNKTEIVTYYQTKQSEWYSTKSVLDLLESSTFSFPQTDQEKQDWFKELFGDQNSKLPAKRAKTWIPFERIDIDMNNGGRVNTESSALSGNRRFIFNPRLTLNDKRNLQLETKEKLLDVRNQIQLLNNNISQVIITQKNNFEDRKRKKKQSKYNPKNNIINEGGVNTSNGEISFERVVKKIPWQQSKSVSINYIDIYTGANNHNNNALFGLRNESNSCAHYPVKSRKESFQNNEMIQEIEAFIDSNIKEMYKAFEETKESFKEDIAAAETDGIEEITQGWKADLEDEWENVKTQFEVAQQNGIEKIRENYNYKKQANGIKRGKSAFI